MTTTINRAEIAATLNTLTYFLYIAIKHNIEDFKLDGSFLISDFFKRNEIKSGDSEYNLFHSSYITEVVSATQKRLLSNGYKCEIVVEKNRILYFTRIVNRQNWMRCFVVMLMCMAAAVLSYLSV